VYELVCHECGVYSDVHAAGWRAYRIGETDGREPLRLAFYCPSCAKRVFGPVGERHDPRRSRH
jgi:hypothetical protein